MDQATYNKFSKEFDMLVRDAMIWFSNRKRYSDTRLEVIDSINTTGKEYACYKKILGISKIVIYKRSFIEFYYNTLSTVSKINAFFISTIAHELAHRKQCITTYNKDFARFIAAYKNDKLKIEGFADRVEYRTFEFISNK